MGTENFNHVKPALGYGENVQLVSQVWGDPVTGIAPENAPSADGNVKLAGLFSTAPYIPPPTLSRGDGFCEGKEHTCNARPVSGTRLCYFHSQGRK